MVLSFQPPIIAHRGARAVAPENTLSAFQKAKELGVNWVEFDVQLCADELVILHDKTLDRTTNGKGSLIDYPYSYLKTLDAGSWFNSQFVGENIPTLRETLGLLTRLGMNANIEIKLQPGKEDLMVEQLLFSLSQYWGNVMFSPLISSFSLDILQRLRKRSEDLMLGFIFNDWQEKDWEICKKINCISLVVDHHLLDAERVKRIKDESFSALAYTVNDPQQARLLFEMGVDAIFTDDIEKIILK